MLTRANKPKTPTRFLYRMFKDVMPMARTELQTWTERANHIPNETLRIQALQSLTHKRFHADGGCVYAAMERQSTKQLVQLIVALQTISDYLDNLCDRCALYNPLDFRQLHHAMRDAVRPGNPVRNYYQYREDNDDNGYLVALVLTCQQVLADFPGYPVVQEKVCWLVERYCELQEHKHIEPALRRQTLINWCKEFQADYPTLTWWEFAAATGSTLGMFALFLAATNELTANDAEKIYAGYFPWVCGLHILLDYLIDLEEDKLEGDFNFVRCYESAKTSRQRIRLFAKQSWQRTKDVPCGGRIHRFVVQGLLGMYLSDAKVASQRHVRRVRRLVWMYGPTAWMFYVACMVYRVVR